MAPVTNARLIFKEIPTGYPEPGKTTALDSSETIDLEDGPLNGGFLIKILLVSIDPYMRAKMRDVSVQSYSPAYILGEPIYNYGVGVVLRSEHGGVKKGNHVYGLFPFQQYLVKPNLEEVRIIENKEGLPWSVYVGALGMPGQTAILAWREWSEVKKGETVFVTAAAGPVGSIVVQLAKSAGAKVIASAGSEEKIEYIKSLGADVVFNYKTKKTAEVLAREGPINIYWDNVGGESLDAALAYAAKYARFIECGMIAGYNEEAPPVRNLFKIVAQEIRLYGFLVFSLLPKNEESFYAEVPGLIARGELKWKEERTLGLENAGEAILAVQRGTNKAKSVVIIADE